MKTTNKIAAAHIQSEYEQSTTESLEYKPLGFWMLAESLERWTKLTGFRNKQLSLILHTLLMMMVMEEKKKLSLHSPQFHKPV
jgi:hypothetical protein